MRVVVTSSLCHRCCWSAVLRTISEWLSDVSEEFLRLPYEHTWGSPASLGLPFPPSTSCFWQGSSDGISKSMELHQGRARSQVNGNNSTLVMEEKSDHLPAPSQCALSKDSNVCNNDDHCLPVKNGEKNQVQEQELETVAQEKEEWQTENSFTCQEEEKTILFWF